jgi:hypothetical protein
MLRAILPAGVRGRRVGLTVFWPRTGPQALQWPTSSRCEYWREASGVFGFRRVEYVDGWAHNPKVVGSNPTPATNQAQHLGRERHSSPPPDLPAATHIRVLSLTTRPSFLLHYVRAPRYLVSKATPKPALRISSMLTTSYLSKTLRLMLPVTVRATSASPPAWLEPVVSWGR